MTINPIETLEYRDANQNGIEDRAEGLYKPQDLILESNLPKTTPVEMPTFSPTEDNAVEMPRYSPNIKDFTDIIFDPFNPVDYASLGAGPGGKVFLAANKARKLLDKIKNIKVKEEKAIGDYQRGKAQLRANEPQGGDLMKKSSKKYSDLRKQRDTLEKKLLKEKSLEGNEYLLGTKYSKDVKPTPGYEIIAPARSVKGKGTRLTQRKITDPKLLEVYKKYGD